MQEDVVKGTFWPAFVLCKSYTTSEKRSGYQIIQIVDGVQTKSNPRVLFTETTGHEDLIGFMSSYQRMDKNHKHYHPKGYLCWYGCNQYGEMNGYIQPIKRVPEFIWIFDFGNRGYQKMKKDQEKKKKLSEILSAEPRGSPFPEANVKLKFNQESVRETRRKNKDARNKENRNK